MSYKHGVGAYEIPTSIVPPVTSMAGLTVAVGTAPVNLIQGNAPVNKPILAYTYKEAVQKLGYSDDFEKYTLCESISAHFALFGVAPIVLINVLDPDVHKASGTEIVSVIKKEAVLEAEGVLMDSVIVRSADDATTYGVEEYELTFDDEGKMHVFMVALATGEIKVEFERLDASAVDTNDIIGGVSMDGTLKGLELVNQVFPLFRVVPGTLIAPKFSADTAVAAVMAAKTANINGYFKALALVDLPTTELKDYTTLAKYKNDNNITSPNQVALWPKVSLGGKQYHLSSQMAALMCATDAKYEHVPYKSPSNENLQADSAVLEDGTEITLGPDQAEYLNGQGIVTALNFIGGWKLWGNRTACYPANSDPKDAFIAVKRMFNYEQNSLILTYWQKVDNPMNRNLIETVIDSKNIDLNGKTNRGFLLGGRVEFLEIENPTTSLIDGIATFHMYLTPPTPARELKFLVEFDPSYFSTLFG